MISRRLFMQSLAGATLTIASGAVFSAFAAANKAATQNPTTKDTMDNLSNLGERLTYFTAGNAGQWKIRAVTPVTGEGLAGTASHLALAHMPAAASTAPVWALRGVSSNTRYVTNSEKAELLSKQSGLDRPEATRAALIPIRKNAAWWALSQEERRDIFETQSHHTANSMPYLPAIARKLHHCHDIGEPFDFLTWFEYAPEHADAFEQLVKTLRASKEWTYVDREVDIRLERA
ncbi:MAG: chlorite dismutase family protein [Rickettsiales bacterium]